MKVIVKYDDDYSVWAIKWDKWNRDFVRIEGKLLWVNISYGWQLIPQSSVCLVVGGCSHH